MVFIPLIEFKMGTRELIGSTIVSSHMVYIWVMSGTFHARIVSGLVFACIQVAQMSLRMYHGQRGPRQRAPRE